MNEPHTNNHNASRHDDSELGQLRHEWTRTIAEYQTTQLSAAIKDGQRRKARAGGTLGRAPIGYLNTCAADEHGRHRPTVAVDPERGPLVTQAFKRFANHNLTLRELQAAAKEVGLTTRPTTKRPGRPLTVGELHRMLRNPYYHGVVTYDGETFPGVHKPLVDQRTWNNVQQRLDKLARGAERYRSDTGGTRE